MRPFPFMVAVSRRRRLHPAAAAWLLVLLLPWIALAASAAPRVQESTGHLDLQDSLIYELPGLKKGETLYVHAEGTSGNLDPSVGILKPAVDVGRAREEFLREREKIAAAEPESPQALLPLFDKYFLAWDDDSGPGYSARFKLSIPADGDYRLILGGSPLRPSFGDYRLLLGIDAPQVMGDTAAATGDTLARLGQAVWQGERRVQEVSGTLLPEQDSTSVELQRIFAGETLTAVLEVAPGTPAPGLVLYDYGDKPLEAGPAGAQDSRVTLRFTFDEKDENPRLKLKRSPGADRNPLDFRLRIGVNAPDILGGPAAPTGKPVVRPVTPVEIGLRLDQITGVDQRAENFGVVVSLMLKWRDPDLAFDPESCKCRLKIFNGDAFPRYVQSRHTDWPDFVLFNQQGNRWSQKRLATVYPDGEVSYFERFGVTLQAPDFKFRKFPFDDQTFSIRIDLVEPSWDYVFRDLEGFSEVGARLGEEQWHLTGFNTRITTETDTVDFPTSRFTFQFHATRHLDYYVYRIFLPILIIVIVSWFGFFLRDYGKRVDVAGANLLLFIAFNFTIGNDLPRLGYLTFLDTFLVTAFVITSLVFLLAVYMKRMEADGKQAIAHRIDKHVMWLYPLAYILGTALTLWFYA
jgi:Neurotransmitter-gated ion-channel ligand binding domain